MKRNFFIAALCLLMAAPLFTSCGFGGSSSKKQETPKYKSVRAALRDGDIHYGMSYEEVEKICGPASSTSRRNGRVEYAYYGNIQLCFWNGISWGFDRYNEH